MGGIVGCSFVTGSPAYVLKESFGQLWDYRSERWPRKFFDNWQAQLKWQRLKPYDHFAAMIERHWDGRFTANPKIMWRSASSGD
ncbi:MAG: transposase [Acidiferrobacterales bacterium]